MRADVTAHCCALARAWLAGWRWTDMSDEMKGTSDKSKARLGKMMDGFSEFEGIMKDATRVCA